MSWFDDLRNRLADFIQPGSPTDLASVTAKVDDSPGWTSVTGSPHDYDPAKVQELYSDALRAWRKNPLAWRIVGITSDFVVGDKMKISSGNRNLNKFISSFWNHEKNMMSYRLVPMCDELSRAGDLFALLFRNEMDGMSYIRFVTKDRIVKIETQDNDWETEIAYHEMQDIGDPKVWYSPKHPRAIDSDSVMLHYSINRPIGALMGDSDLTTMIPWLQRYSRMLEDRVRLHWAVRAFLWVVTVPANKVKEKTEQYRRPPEAGSIVVKDAGEEWNVITPTLRGSDAAHDLRAVRGMVDAGSGYPPHWRGESGDANLATATAMQGPTERHLLRRQKYFVFMLQDILYKAYQRALEINKVRKLASSNYEELFSVSVPDISRSDNEVLARSARDISTGIQSLAYQLPGYSETYSKLALRLFYKFVGEPQSEETITDIFSEAEENDYRQTQETTENPSDNQPDESDA